MVFYCEVSESKGDRFRSLFWSSCGITVPALGVPFERVLSAPNRRDPLYNNQRPILYLRVALSSRLKKWGLNL